MLTKPSINSSGDLEMFYSSLNALDNYMGSMMSLNFGGGDYLGADWDRYNNAVRKGYKGSIRDFEDGIYRDQMTTKDGTILVVRIYFNPKFLTYLNYPITINAKVDCNVLVFGKSSSKYNFVQTYFDNFPDKGTYTWCLDANDPNGFYNDALRTGNYSLPNFKKLGLHPNGFFQDTPNDQANFSAELSVCGLQGNTWVEIGSYSWGYTVEGGSVIPYFKESNGSNSAHRENLSNTLYYYNTH